MAVGVDKGDDEAGEADASSKRPNVSRPQCVPLNRAGSLDTGDEAFALVDDAKAGADVITAYSEFGSVADFQFAA